MRSRIRSEIRAAGAGHGNYPNAEIQVQPGKISRDPQRKRLAMARRAWVVEEKRIGDLRESLTRLVREERAIQHPLLHGGDFHATMRARADRLPLGVETMGKARVRRRLESLERGRMYEETRVQHEKREFLEEWEDWYSSESEEEKDRSGKEGEPAKWVLEEGEDDKVICIYLYIHFSLQ